MKKRKKTAEEEKKAIEMLKDRYKDLLESSKNTFYSSDKKLYKEHAEQINIILNLLDKQQKEIERKNKLIEKDRIALENCLKYRSEEDYE